MIRVMVVDDEESIIEMFENLQEFFGLKVEAVASDGDQATAVYPTINPRPDVVILDHRMPHMDGLQTMHSIFERDPEARFVFLSADRSVEKRVLSEGAAAFIGKPFTIDELKEAIARAAGLRELEGDPGMGSSPR